MINFVTMKRIFLTGATGVMGSHGLKELMSSPQQYKISVIARDSRKNRKKLAPYIRKGVKVIWGDLLDKDAIAQGVRNADVVLHVGGMVSPAADWHPDKTIATNVGSMKNIIEAALPVKNEVKLVYIGSVSQYGPRHAPYHWGRCGDPLVPAMYDAYAYSKTEAERLLMESDLKWWVSLRQTGILHSGLLKKASDPISFHVPLAGVLEWVTAEDSGRLLERVCRDDVPESFWGKCYNIGGGSHYRLTNYEFEKMILNALGCPPPEKIFRPNWFATDNFHGLWYVDSDALDEILHFRSGITPEEYFIEMKRRLPWYFSLAPLVPAFAIRLYMKKVAETPVLGPLWWLKNDETSSINAAWGSREAWESIPGWSGLDLKRPCDNQAEAKPFPHPDDEIIQRVSVSDSCGSGENEEILHIRCCRCSNEYSLKARTFAAGHRCPACLEKSLKINKI